MIAGAGVDVATIARVGRLVRDHEADLERIFTARERRHCEAARPAARDGRYAAAFAAKEAVFKALGTGWRSDLEWSDVDTRRVDDLMNNLLTVRFIVDYVEHKLKATSAA